MENVAIKIVQKGEAEMTCNIKIVSLGAHDAEPISPIQALGVNPFPSKFIIRTVPKGGFARPQWEEPIATTLRECYSPSSKQKEIVYVLENFKL